MWGGQERNKRIIMKIFQRFRVGKRNGNFSRKINHCIYLHVPIKITWFFFFEQFTNLKRNSPFLCYTFLRFLLRVTWLDEWRAGGSRDWAGTCSPSSGKPQRRTSLWKHYETALTSLGLLGSPLSLQPWGSCLLGMVLSSQFSQSDRITLKSSPSRGLFIRLYMTVRQVCFWKSEIPVNIWDLKICSVIFLMDILAFLHS